MRKLLVALTAVFLSLLPISPFTGVPLIDVPVAHAATASGALAPAPLNFNFDAPSQILPGVVNADFETGVLSPWTVSGPVTIGAGGPTGYYAQVAAGQTGTLTSAVIDMDDATQMLTYDRYLGPNGTAYI